MIVRNRCLDTKERCPDGWMHAYSALGINSLPMAVRICQEKINQM
jgi:hypothetical protein